jgi:hypothetical protein
MNMKKSYILSLVCLICLTLAQVDSSAQEFEKGSIVINPGLGLGYYYGGGFAVGFAVNAEFSITDEIAVGPYIAFTRWDYAYGAGYDYAYTFIDFGARGSYHFAKLLKVNNEQFDPYAGAFLGFVSSSYSSDFSNGDDPYDGGVRGGVYAGARWFFTPMFAAFGEVGVGLYPILIGVTFKLK